tara:strand:+ start:798 stop:1157 length:360 start_codon:yes stop_codon:yes gene_type:complete
MATNPLHKYTVQESNNLQVYENYSSVTITVDDDNADNAGTDWTSSGDGLAKEVTIIPISGTAGDTIKVALKIGGSWGDDITVKFDDFPITINNLLIDQIRIESSGGTSTAEVFEVLSFH